MPPLISRSAFSPSWRKTVAHGRLQSRASTLICELSRTLPCKSLVAWPVVSIAKFGTASAKRAESNHNVMGMRPAQRIEARRKEQLDIDARALERNFTRVWKAGDVYAPHDLSAAEARKWRKRKSPTTDAFDALAMNPLDCYKNFSIMSEYMTQMGRIKHSRDTGLRAVNQRKIAKAIRRAVGVGLMPSVHRHPELIKRELRDTRMSGRAS